MIKQYFWIRKKIIGYAFKNFFCRPTVLYYIFESRKWVMETIYHTALQKYEVHTLAIIHDTVSCYNKGKPWNTLKAFVGRADQNINMAVLNVQRNSTKTADSINQIDRICNNSLNTTDALLNDKQIYEMVHQKHIFTCTLYKIKLNPTKIKKNTFRDVIMLCAY